MLKFNTLEKFIRIKRNIESQSDDLKQDNKKSPETKISRLYLSMNNNYSLPITYYSYYPR
ncbi:hypothetical protein J3D55_003628 [Chryseobacterium ginsenosidimutans]|nr:hypothetical protein [Chryseobacterium ginsenosidimutans]